MTVFAIIRQDRITNILDTNTPASYVELPAWATKFETRELPGTVAEVLDTLSADYAWEYVSSSTEKNGDSFRRYKLTPYPVGADGHPVRSLETMEG